MAPDTGNVDGRSHLVLIVVLTVIFSVIVLRSAWVCDDAYITFRTADNFVNGYGLTWNTGERVQAYTNPLWLFVTAAVYVFSREFYYASIILSLVLSIGMVVVLARKVSLSVQSAALAVVVLVCSKAFIDYSTSGLENPLTHLLLVIFAAVYFADRRTPRRLFWLALIAALGMLNRLDTVLLYLPALVAAFFGTTGGGRIKRMLLGMLPIVGWEIFSLIYYGFPFPNTYYAKLKAGVPAADLVRQGLVYYVDTLDLDPLTLIVIVSGIVLVWVGRKREQVPFVLGVVLYLVYIVRIGGDFMSGRFFAAPMLVSVILISRFPLAPKGVGLWAPFATILLLGLTSPRSPLLADSSYGTAEDYDINSRGIADERGWYYPTAGLLCATRAKDMPTNDWKTRGEGWRKSGAKVVTWGTVGFAGHAAGPHVHIVDTHGLADPVLARLPTISGQTWRIGHLARAVPDGYLETLESGENRVADSALSVWFDKLRTITTGAVWSWNRFAEVVRMNLGRYDGLLRAYVDGAMRLIPYSRVNTPRARGTWWNDSGNLIMDESGLTVLFDRATDCNSLELSVDHNDDYELEFLKDRSVVGGQLVLGQTIREHGLRVDTVMVPDHVCVAGYTAVHISPVRGDGAYSLGHLRLLCEPTGL